MVHDASPPTLFLTFSCADYESPDIIDYLKIVNDDCGDSNAGKLCTEDPVSVSRQFHLSSMPSSTQLLLGTKTTFTGKKSIRHVEHLTITCSCGYVMHQ